MLAKARRISHGLLVGALFTSGALARYTQAQNGGPLASEVRVPLSQYGLPSGFFSLGTDTKCSAHIIGYRFVVWLNAERVSVGFNTSPNCRQSPNRKVDGMAHLLVFDLHGVVQATRDVAYLADGNGEIVADGEAKSGPGGTLLFRIQSVNLDPEGAHESKSGILLLDAKLNTVAQIDEFLEQTTFVDHALIFQKGFTMGGPRAYTVVDGAPPTEIQHWSENWPVGTMDRKFGEHQLAYMLCKQELQPGKSVSTNIIYEGVPRHCSMNVETADRAKWDVSLKEQGSAAIVGTLNDGSVAGEINLQGVPAGRLVIWRKDQSTEVLPWIPADYSGEIESGTASMSRYAAYASNDSRECIEFEKGCSTNAHWFIFDRQAKLPIVNRTFPRNGRAALSPDGRHYASFESGELHIYPLP